MKIIKSEDMNKHKITKVINREYAQKLIDGKFNESFCKTLENKPIGFWLSVNGGWEEWCQSEMPEWLNDSVVIDIEFNSGFNIMVIDDVPDIINVWKEYLEESNFDSMSPDGHFISCFISHTNKKCDFWDWLIKKYNLSGIYLTDDGQWKTRLDSFMYGWDCESIVIFNNQLILNKNNGKLLGQIKQ